MGFPPLSSTSKKVVDAVADAAGGVAHADVSAKSRKYWFAKKDYHVAFADFFNERTSDLVGPEWDVPKQLWSSTGSHTHASLPRLTALSRSSRITTRGRTDGRTTSRRLETFARSLRDER